MWFVYILFSLKDEGIYIGKTNNISRRYKEHSLGRVKSTKNRRPLILVSSCNLATERMALNLEKQLKKGFMREEIKAGLGLK